MVGPSFSISMHRKRTALHILLCALTACIVSTGCGKAIVAGGPIPPDKLRDGVYEGSASSWPNSAKVRVTIVDGRIAKIHLVSHISSWIGTRAEGEVQARIIDRQSTKVDAVTGATNSSNVIMNAVQNAVMKAHQQQ